MGGGVVRSLSGRQVLAVLQLVVWLALPLWLLVLMATSVGCVVRARVEPGVIVGPGWYAGPTGCAYVARCAPDRCCCYDSWDRWLGGAPCVH